MKQLNVIGGIFGSSGYDSHTRQLASALFKKTKTRLTTSLVNNWQRFCKDHELEMIKREAELFEDNLAVINPTFWKTHLGPGRNFVYCVWEGDKVPSWFIEEMSDPLINAVIVPSEHTKNAILNMTTDEEVIGKIRVVPHGVDTSLFFPREKTHTGFRFFANKGFTSLEDRGGIQYLLRAYMEEFSLKDDVELVIKINPAYHVPDLQRMVSELAPENREDLPKIVFITDNVPFEDLPLYYAQTDVFVSPTRAESFNLPCLEALACGKPVITTSFGGQSEFVNQGNGWIINGELKEVEHDVYYEGIKWLTPSISELRKALREAFSQPELVKAKSEKAVEDARDLTWDHTADKILEILSEEQKNEEKN